MNTRCPPKRVPSAAHFFTLCRLTVQPPQSYSVGGQRSSGQLTGKPAGTQLREASGVEALCGKVAELEPVEHCYQVCQKRSVLTEVMKRSKKSLGSCGSLARSGEVDDITDQEVTDT
ncbi:UNVERIFIED_CONTAM: hypothetical protein FKN15_057168 [Acipenser sinensis]